MVSPKAGGWIAGTAFLSVVILAAAWLLVISPVREGAGETREAAQAQRDQNDFTLIRIEALKEQAANLDAMRAELAGLHQQIPTTRELAVYQLQLANIAAVHSVTISSVNVGPATAVSPAAVAAAPEPEADDAASEDTASDAADPATPVQPTAVPGTEGLYSLSVSLDVTGTYANVLAFLEDLRGGGTGTQRLFLASGLTATRLDDSEGTAGVPGTVNGDLQVVVTGQIYVLVDNGAAIEPEPALEGPAPVLPVPDPGKNPFAQLG